MKRDRKIKGKRKEKQSYRERKRAGDNLGPKTKRGKVKASEKRGGRESKEETAKDGKSRRERREKESE